MNGDFLFEMETFFLALADKTRLRLLNLMREDEICVCFFTEVLGQSQPKISRHLAYLRNAGIVEARRDGKWMHYRISWPLDNGGQALLRAAIGWLSGTGQPGEDRQRSGATLGSTEAELDSEMFESDVYAQADLTTDAEADSRNSGHN